MKKTVRLAGIAYESLVNGPGIRRVFFAQGCKHNCKGCFNPETHSFDKGIVLEIDKLIKDVLENPMITGVTFSGGDPIEQAHSFSYMAKILKNKGLNIWCYTGFTFEQLLIMTRSNKKLLELLNTIDVLVDGKFILEEKSFDVIFRGSKNQRILDIKKSLSLKKACEVSKYKNKEEVVIKKEYVFV